MHIVYFKTEKFKSKFNKLKEEPTIKVLIFIM